MTITIPSTGKLLIFGFIVVLVCFVSFLFFNDKKGAQRNQGAELLQKDAVAVEQAKPEDRAATPEESKRVLQLRKEIPELAAEYQKLKERLRRFDVELSILSASNWEDTLYKRWEAGTLKDADLPKIVKAFSDSQKGWSEFGQEVTKSLTEVGFDYFVLPDEKRVNWDLMQNTVRYPDVVRYESIAFRLQRAIDKMKTVTDAEKQQVVEAITRVLREIPANSIQPHTCEKCKRYSYAESTSESQEERNEEVFSEPVRDSREPGGFRIDRIKVKGVYLVRTQGGTCLFCGEFWTGRKDSTLLQRFRR